jgi:hypothetical protein
VLGSPELCDLSRWVIASGQAMFTPGLNGFSYGVGPVVGRKAVSLVSTQDEQLLLRFRLGLPAHPPPLPLARGIAAAQSWNQAARALSYRQQAA